MIGYHWYLKITEEELGWHWTYYCTFLPFPLRLGHTRRQIAGTCRGDKSRGHVAGTNPVVCTMRNLVARTKVCPRDMSHGFKMIWIHATCRGDKSMSPRLVSWCVLNGGNVLRDMSLGLVAWCVLTFMLSWHKTARWAGRVLGKCCSKFAVHAVKTKSNICLSIFSRFLQVLAFFGWLAYEVPTLKFRTACQPIRMLHFIAGKKN